MSKQENINDINGRKTEIEQPLIRLNKYLSDRGVCSRRQADKLVEEGRIMIDDHIAVMGEKVSDEMIILVDGKKITKEEEKVVIAFNKPVGIECTTDKSNKDNIVDYIGYSTRIYPIGRLDKNSEGLILLTNDGSIVNGILKGSSFKEKEYIVTVDKQISDDFISKMSEGVAILDTVTRPCKVTKLNKNSFNIVLTQGLNRQIRRMCKALGYNVQKLKRIRVMNIKLGNLVKGQYRTVEGDELRELLSLLDN